MNHPITLSGIQGRSSLMLALTLIVFSGCGPEEVIDIDSEAPVVAITSPSDGASLTGQMELSITASDNNDVSRVTATLNGLTIAFLEEEPYAQVIDLSIFMSGQYPLQATATDAAGNSSTVSINITIVNGSNIDRPIGLAVSKGTFGNKILIDWEDIPNAQKYQVFRHNGDVDYVQIAETEESQFEDNVNLEPLTKAYYKVRVYNSNLAYSEFSDIDYGYISGKTYDLVTSFGSEGTGNGQFLFAEHLKLDADNHIYVSDPNVNRIQKFDLDGNFQEIFYSCNSCRGIAFLPNGNTIIAESANYKISIIDASKQVVKQWGSNGASDGQFFYFRQIALDTEGKLYVVDHANHRIQKFDLDGNFETKWGTNGTAHGQFVYPWGITIYKDMVAVSSEQRVQFFTKTGTFIKQLDLGVGVYDLATDGTSLFIAASAYVIKTDEVAEVIDKIGDGDFTLVSGVDLSSDGQIVTTDVYKRRISVYRKNQ